MPFDTPSLPALVSRVADDLAKAALRKSDAEVMSRVHAGATYGLYGYLDWIARQILPDTADEETLLRMALLRLRQQRLPAVSASGMVRCTGASGALVPVGTLLQSSDGRRYRVTGDATLAAGVADVGVEAVEPGQLGNLDSGAELALVSPIAGVADACTVNAPGITGGTDAESIESLRQRVIRSYRVIPHGGSADDYVTWALEVPGVTRAWCLPGYMGPGTVGVFFVRDNDASPIPDASEIATVQAHIDTQRPVAAELYVMAPAQVVLNFEIHVVPDSMPVRAAVEASLRELLASESAPGATLLRTHISAAISNSTGERDHTLISPAADVAVADNELLTFGSITWV